MAVVATLRKKGGRKFVKFYKNSETAMRAKKGYEKSGKGYFIGDPEKANKSNVRSAFDFIKPSKYL